MPVVRQRGRDVLVKLIISYNFQTNRGCVSRHNMESMDDADSKMETRESQSLSDGNTSDGQSQGSTAVLQLHIYEINTVRDLPVSFNVHYVCRRNPRVPVTWTADVP